MARIDSNMAASSDGQCASNRSSKVHGKQRIEWWLDAWMGESTAADHNPVHKSPEQLALDPLLPASAARSSERILAGRERHLHLQLLKELTKIL